MYRDKKFREILEHLNSVSLKYVQKISHNILYYI
jgi:hypothetical protein